jgi:tRNA(Met) C34 N-acetyltransferase TmcA
MSDRLLERLKAGTDNRKTIPFPGTDTKVVIRPLSEAERQAAHFATEQHFRNKGIDVTMSTVEAYEAEKTIQLLYKAVSDEEGNSLAATVRRFAELLTINEKNALVDEYMAHEMDSSPNPETLSEEEVDEILEDLKKNQTIPGSVSSMSTARQLITSLANRLRTLQQASGSTS